MNIFEQASRLKLRFPSIKGEITTEQLWDLPLSSKAGFDLDSVARTVNAELKAAGEESFVATTISPAKAALELRLEVVKHVIGVRLADNEANRNAAVRQAERARLTEILAKKEDAALEQLSPEEIRKRIAELGS